MMSLKLNKFSFLVILLLVNIISLGCIQILDLTMKTTTTTTTSTLTISTTIKPKTTTTTYETTTTTTLPRLKVHFIDVGEGDAILLEKEGKYALIDCGADYRKIYLYLFKRNIGVLDFLLVTNPKAEHVGACDVILKNFYVNEIFDNGQQYDDEPYKNYIKLAQERNYKTVARDYSINFQNAELKVLWPPVTRPKGDLRGNSIVTKLIFGNIIFMLMSDCDVSCENQIYGNLSADILKVGFSGSKFSSSQQFLKEVNPKVAIISVGRDNIYNHPDPITLNKLKNVEVHRTDFEGTIIIETDGETFSVIPEHEPITETTTTPPKIITTTTSTTTFTTTTTTTKTTTTTTTTTVITTTTKTTTTYPTTTTTLCKAKCCENSDCPPDKVIKNYSCQSDKIFRQYISYRCIYPGTPSANCLGTYHSDLIKTCNYQYKGYQYETCMEDEPYCKFIKKGRYDISKPPKYYDLLVVNDDVFTPYYEFSFKIKYVISDREKPKGLTMFVKMPSGTTEKIYFIDRYGTVLNSTVMNNLKVGIKTIFIHDIGINAELWGIRT